MGLLGSLLVEPLGTIILLSTPARAATIERLAADLSQRTGADREKCEFALRMAIHSGEAKLLDTDEGRAVILQDAAEVVGLL